MGGEVAARPARPLPSGRPQAAPAPGAPDPNSGTTATGVEESARAVVEGGRVHLERSVRDGDLEVIRRVAIPPRRRDSTRYLVTARALDIVGSAALLLATAPAVALLWLVIRIDSKGSPIFRQQRVGHDGKLFTFYKFRTMYLDARERFPELYAYDYDEEQVETLYFKLPYDPRCTRVGRWLRRTSLDELPNLYNVLRGDMTLVGPRPESPEMVAHYRDDQLLKFSVKPGLTGLAQVSGRNILRFQETLAHDLAYVDARNTRTDLRILRRTVGAVVLMMGAH